MGNGNGHITHVWNHVVVILPLLMVQTTNDQNKRVCGLVDEKYYIHN